MNKLQKGCVALLMVGTTLSTSSCILAAREAIGTARGGHSSTDITQPVVDLSAYHTVWVDQFHNAVGRDVTPAYLAEFSQDLQSGLKNNNLEQGTQPALRLTGNITALRSSVGYRHMVVAVTLQDAKSGVILGKATVTSKVSGVRSFSEVLAAAADGIVELITTHQKS